METELVTFLSNIYDNVPFIGMFLHSSAITCPLLTEAILVAVHVVVHASVCSKRVTYYFMWRSFAWLSYYIGFWLISVMGLDHPHKFVTLFPIFLSTLPSAVLFTLSELSLYKVQRFPYPYFASLWMMIPISKYFDIGGFMNIFLLMYGIGRSVTLSGHQSRTD